MMGCHVYSTKPARARGQTPESPLSPAEVCTMALSALEWRKHNGPMRLYADSQFASFVAKTGLEWIYDAGINTTVLGTLPEDIRYDTFWAAPKIFAYAAAELPAAFLDVDLILWGKVPDCAGQDVLYLHPEANSRGDGRDYILPPGHRLPPYPWDGEEFNLGFVVLNNESLRQEFVTEAAGFMRGNEAQEPWKHMCFAEQYLLAQCAKARKAKTRALLNGPPGDESVVTHLWGVKRKFRENPIRGRAWMNRCLERLETEFPPYRPQLRPLARWAEEAAESQLEQAGIRGPELLRRLPRRFATPVRHNHHSEVLQP